MHLKHVASFIEKQCTKTRLLRVPCAMHHWERERGKENYRTQLHLRIKEKTFFFVRCALGTAYIRFCSQPQWLWLCTIKFDLGSVVWNLHTCTQCTYAWFFTVPFSSLVRVLCWLVLLWYFCDANRKFIWNSIDEGRRKRNKLNCAAQCISYAACITWIDAKYKKPSTITSFVVYSSETFFSSFPTFCLVSQKSGFMWI